MFNDRDMAFFKQMAETFGTTLEEQIEDAIAAKRQWYLDAFATIAEEPFELNPGFDPSLDYAAMTLEELNAAFNKYMDEGMEALFAEDNKLNALIKNSDNVVKLF